MRNLEPTLLKAIKHGKELLTHLEKFNQDLARRSYRLGVCQALALNMRLPLDEVLSLYDTIYEKNEAISTV